MFCTPVSTLECALQELHSAVVGRFCDAGHFNAQAGLWDTQCTTHLPSLCTHPSCVPCVFCCVLSTVLCSALRAVLRAVLCCALRAVLRVLATVPPAKLDTPRDQVLQCPHMRDFLGPARPNPLLTNLAGVYDGK